MSLLEFHFCCSFVEPWEKVWAGGRVSVVSSSFPTLPHATSCQQLTCNQSEHFAHVGKRKACFRFAPSSDHRHTGNHLEVLELVKCSTDIRHFCYTSTVFWVEFCSKKTEVCFLELSFWRFFFCFQNNLNCNIKLFNNDLRMKKTNFPGKSKQIKQN